MLEQTQQDYQEEEASFNPKALSKVGAEIIGNKSIKEFCEETHLSRSTVSRIINGSTESPPSIKTIRKFTSQKPDYVYLMLIHSGYPPNTLNKLEAPLPIAAIKEAAHSWLPVRKTMGLAFMLLLIEAQYANSQINIEYQYNCFFLIRTPDQIARVGIIAFCDGARDAVHTVKSATSFFADAVDRWKKEDKISYTFLTNSESVYGILKNRFPNLFFNVSVIFTDGYQKIASTVIPRLSDSKLLGGDVNPIV